jgi:putative sigma-54 modulation protein
MRIDIQTSGFKLTGGLREHTERRLRFALSWAVHDVRKVVVRLSDINGPRGGNDNSRQAGCRDRGYRVRSLCRD